MSKKNKLFTGMFLGTVLGGIYGMLFAQKKGATLRKEIKDTLAKKGNLYELLAKEIGLTGKESSKVIKETVESKEFQKFLKEGKNKAEELCGIVCKEGDKYSQEAKKTIDHLARLAQEKAEELGITMKKSTVANKVKKNVKRTTKTAAKKAEKTVKNIKKRITKK